MLYFCPRRLKHHLWFAQKGVCTVKKNTDYVWCQSRHDRKTDVTLFLYWNLLMPWDDQDFTQFKDSIFRPIATYLRETSITLPLLGIFEFKGRLTVKVFGICWTLSISQRKHMNCGTVQLLLHRFTSQQNQGIQIREIRPVQTYRVGRRRRWREKRHG